MKLFKFFNDKSNVSNDAVSEPEVDRNGIMIVDDSRFSRNVLRDILENEGFEVVGEAGDGQEAVEKAKELSPEIIFLDVEMPVLDGLGALPKIMKHDSGINVIMCTALGQKKIIMEATRAGAKDYVIKPYRKENITDVLIPYEDAKIEAKAKAKAEAEAAAEEKAKAEAEAFFEVEGQADSTEEAILEEPQDSVEELETTDSDEMKPLGYTDEEETLGLAEPNEEPTLGSLYELNSDTLQETEDSEVSNEEEETLSLLDEFEETTDGETKDEEYEGLLISDEFDELDEIQESDDLVKEINDVETSDVELEDIETLEEEQEEVEDIETLEEEQEEVEDIETLEEEQEEVEDIETLEKEVEDIETLEKEVEDIETLEEELEELEDIETLEEEEDLWAGVFDKSEEVEEIVEEVKQEEVVAIDDSTTYSFIYLNRFDSQLEGVVEMTTPSSKRVTMDYKLDSIEGSSKLLGKNDSERFVMLGIMGAYILQSDERTNPNKETPNIKLAIKSNDNRRYVQDFFGHDMHNEELSMLNILSKVNFTDVSSIKLDNKNDSGLYCAIKDLVTKYNQRELSIY